MITIKGVHLIAGKESRKGTTTFRPINPANGEPSKIAFTNATNDEIDRALSEARKAFDTRLTFSNEQRAVFLEQVAEDIEQLGELLLSTAAWETALGSQRLLNERTRTCHQLRLFADYIREGSYRDIIIDTGKPAQKPLPKPDIRRMQIPLGPVVVFDACNFPFAFGICGGDTASAWAAGCPVVVKSHPSHPQTAELFARVVSKAIDTCHFHKGWFSLLQGSRHDVGEQLVLHPLTEAVGFTGSLQGGRALFDLAASRSRPIPVYAEMGSVNPIFFTKNALRDSGMQIAHEVAQSVLLGVGQFCTKPGLLFLPDGKETQRFIKQFVDEIRQVQPGVLLNKSIKNNLVKGMNEVTGLPEIDIVTGGSPLKNRCSFESTVLTISVDAFMSIPMLQQEFFGPVVLAVLCPSMESFIRIAQCLEGQLTASLFAKEQDYDKLQLLLKVLQQKAGRIVFNGVPTGVEVGYAMQHGGPYPATTAAWTTSVGMTAIRRFLRPVCFQNCPSILLPSALQDTNPEHIVRCVNGIYQRNSSSLD